MSGVILPFSHHQAITTTTTYMICSTVGFINPGSLADWLSRKGSGQAGNTQLMGQPKSLKTTGQKSGLVTDRKDWPRRNSARLSTLAHLSDRGMQRPCSLLFSDWRNQSRLGPTDWARPSRRNQGTSGEKQGKAHKSNYDTRECTLYTCRNSTLQPP